jgi:hypothetical protein
MSDFFKPVHVEINMANQSHNPPWSGSPERTGLAATMLRPWHTLEFPPFPDGGANYGIARFLIPADAWDTTVFQFGAYILYDDGQIQWAFKIGSILPWSVSDSGDPVSYYCICYLFDSRNSPG